MTSSGSSTNAHLTQQNKLTLPVSNSSTATATSTTTTTSSTLTAPSSSSSPSNTTTAILLGNVVHHGMSNNESSLHVNNVHQLKMLNQHGTVNANNTSNNLQPILINQSSSLNAATVATTAAATNHNVNATVAVALASDGTTVPLKLSTLSNNFKINQLQPLNATNIIGSGLSQMNTTLANAASGSATSISVVGASSSPSNSNSSISSNASSVNTNTYGGFAHCSNCGEYGVKAAFYGKSKLYCSVACQNGIKKQQMQSQGVKRTAESLNYSPINSASSSISTPPISLAPSASNTTLMTNQTNNQSAIPTLIPINAHQLIQTNTMSSNILPANIIITTGTSVTSSNNVAASSDPNAKLTSNPDQQHIKSTNSLNILNQKSQTSETASSSVVQHSLSNLVSTSSTSNTPMQLSQATSQQTIKQIDTNLSVKTTTTNNNVTTTQPNVNNQQQQQSSLSSSSIASSINSVIQNSADQNDINPRPVKRQRNSSVQSVSSIDSSTTNKNQDKLSTANAKLTNSNQTNNKNSVISTKSTAVSPLSSTKRRNSSLSQATTNHHSSAAFSLHSYIEKEKFEAAPVSIFKHVPLSEFWKRIKCNMIVEVPNKDQPHGSIIEIENVNGGNGSSKLSNSKNSFWFASIVEYAGYLVKLRYIGYESESKADFWMHLCNKDIHSIGWAAENELPLIPPFSIINKTDDWKQYLIDKLTGFKTLPKNFHKLVEESLKSPFKKNMILELVDKKKLSSMRVARIIENIGGRLRMKYENSDEFDDFWCHQLSDIIHPVGWSITVGHDIFASDEYKAKSAIKYKTNNYESSECSPNMFKKPREIKTSRDSSTQFKVNMKLEAIDPLNLSSICVATIGKVLKNNYLMVKIDGYATQDGHDLFCYHRSSSSIFPAGFCQKNSLDLLPPYGYKTKFDWATYLEETKSEFAPVELFYQDTHLQNPFKIGMKLESVDLMEPKLVCIATVVAVVNRLIRLNFDGWSRDYDQWVDCESCDIYPIGWCQLVDYELQAPPSVNSSAESTEANGMPLQCRYNGAIWMPSTSSSTGKKKARKSTTGKKAKILL